MRVVAILRPRGKARVFGAIGPGRAREMAHNGFVIDQIEQFGPVFRPPGRRNSRSLRMNIGSLQSTAPFAGCYALSGDKDIAWCAKCFDFRGKWRRCG
jgi:hypothetical protein